MKYYSEHTKKFYDTEKECAIAEAELKKKDEEARLKKEADAVARKEDAHKVEELMKTAAEAREAYNKALSEFCKKWGSFHTSIDSKNIKNFTDFWDYIDFLELF